MVDKDQTPDSIMKRIDNLEKEYNRLIEEKKKRLVKELEMIDKSKPFLELFVGDMADYVKGQKQGFKEGVEMGIKEGEKKARDEILKKIDIWKGERMILKNDLPAYWKLTELDFIELIKELQSSRSENDNNN